MECLLSFTLLVWFLCALEIQCALQAAYLSSTCTTGTSSFTTSMRIQSSSSLTYSNNMNCIYTVTAPSGHMVLAVPRRFELEEKRSGSCVDYLNFYDGASTSTLLNSQPYCDRTGPHNVSSTGTSMTLNFITDGSAEYRGFDIIFAAVTNAPCGNTYFACSNNLCVDTSLRCDGFNQCGDESDETACTAEELGIVSDNSALIYGLSFGLGSLVVIGILIGVYFYRYYRWKRFLKDPLPEINKWETKSNYPVTNKYYKREYKTYGYTSIESRGASRMSNDFDTDEDLDAESRAMSPTSSTAASKKGKLDIDTEKGPRSSKC